MLAIRGRDRALANFASRLHRTADLDIFPDLKDGANVNCMLSCSPEARSCWSRPSQMEWAQMC